MKSSINILSIILNVFLIFAVIVLLFDRDDEEEYGEEIYRLWWIRDRVLPDW